jgi:hypothetical protein
MAKKNYESALFRFAFFPIYDKSVEYLATTLADPEEWEFSNAVEMKYSILKNYLEHTFRKVQQEGKVAYTNGNTHACFNTGLVTKNLEEIFAFFEAYKNPRADKSNSPFCFRAFLKQSDIQLLQTFPGNLPDIADFFQKPEDLLFNPNCQLIPQIDHIIEDNIMRFPAHMQSLDNCEIRRRLEGAIDEVKRRVKTNYKIAVPQYYDNKIQLLLPLNLTPGSPNPDLALVTHKISTDTYTARTCLTLRMAYNNARLIVKPQSLWLKP